MRDPICAAVLGTLVLTTRADAALFLVNDSRLVRVEASVSSPAGSDSDGPYTSEPTVFGQPFNSRLQAEAIVSNASAGASALQISTIGADFITAEGSVSLASAVGPGGTAFCAGRSLVDLLFDVPGNTRVEFISWRKGDTRIQLLDANDRLIFAGPGAFAGTLSGRLRLLVNCEAATSRPPGQGNPFLNYYVSFTAVPAPTSAGLVVGLAMCGVRRRR